MQLAKPSKRRTVCASLSMVIAVVLQFACTVRAETPGERFDKFINAWTKKCTTLKLRPGETTCDILKLKPADPLATPEGRFAHSIKIPNPVPEDSGYRPGMTSREYFDHLCKTEAGEFIYKTVDNVDGIVLMRPRVPPPYSNNHLHAPEAPFFMVRDGENLTPWKLVGPGRYEYLETSRSLPIPSWQLRRLHSSVSEEAVRPTIGHSDVRYFGFDGKSIKTMRKGFDAHPKSRFGFTWRGIKRPRDREMGVSGSELIVLDIQSKEVLAVLRGYVSFEIDERYGIAGLQWISRCPLPKQDASQQEGDFLLRVLRPTLE